MEQARETWFRLASARGPSGISCDEDGAFVGTVPLLERRSEPGQAERWQPRELEDLNCDLSKSFGLPVEFGRKMPGLVVVARALDLGDLARAQLAMLLLKIPDPAELTKSARSMAEFIGAARRLQSSEMLKADWNPEKHPRWPAGSPDSIGGRFAPANDSSSDSSTVPANTNSSDPSIVLAQTAIPWPFELPIPRRLTIPRPFEVLPPPLVFPYSNPRDRPKNPYPRRKECVKEWEDAEDFCDKLAREGKLGRDGYRGFGALYYQCLLGQVSEDCGGNATQA